MVTVLRFSKGQQFLDGNGRPLALGKLFYFAAGTTSALDTYSRADGAVSNTNPVLLDGSGRLIADIYLGPVADYKEVLTASDGTTVAPWPDDNIPRATQPDWNSTSGASQILNKPSLAAVATSGAYTDLTSKPSAFAGDTGAGGAEGLVPAPAAGDATAGKFLKASGGWAIPPAGSSSSAMTGASSSTAGGSGIVPAPQAGDQAKFLRGDATWQSASGSGGVTNIGVTQAASKVTITSSTGTSADIAAADAVNAGAMSAADKTKLNGIAAGATVQVNADWNATGGAPQVLNKPTLGTAAAKDIPASGNANAAQVVFGTDTRLADSRTPSAHAASHASGGLDALSLAASQVSGIPASLASQNLDTIARLGIGTSDTNNKFSVSAPSVLFANSGDMRATISKGAAANTAAFNFQDNFSTRVQFGLLGDDNFSVQTSPDGAAFKSAFVADKTTGAVSFPNTPSFTGDSGSGGGKGLVPAPASGDAAASKFLKADGTWSVTPTGSGGEANTASNQGTSGVGVFKAKSGVDLQFKKINAASSKLSVADNTTNGSVDVDVNQANLSLASSQVTGLAAVATSGSYADLSNKPLIPVAQVNSDWNAATGVAQISNKPALATVATSGSYNDLSSKPTIPAAQINSDWNATTGLPQILNKPALATVAASGLYADLSNKPTLGTSSAKDIPATGNASATQVVIGTDTRLSDTRSPSAHASSHASGGSDALTIASSQITGLGTASSKTAPLAGVNATATQVVVGDDTRLSDSRTPLAHTQAASTISDSTSAGRAMLTAADATAQTALLNALAGANGTTGGIKGLVPAPAATDNVKFLKGDGTWGTPAGGGGSVDGTNIAPNKVTVRDTGIAGYTGAKFETIQAALQTTDATTFALLTIPIANGETVMVRAFVQAMLADFSGAWFQEVYRVFRRGSTGNAAVIGSASATYAAKDSSVNTSGLMATSLATSGLTSNLLLNIVGEPSLTYNWFVTALVQRLKSNS